MGSFARKSTALAARMLSSRIVGGKEAVTRYMLDKFQYTIPEDYITLTPDIIMYTWVSVFGRPMPAGRPGERHNYVASITHQARTMRDYVHVLFYSRWNMTNEEEMLGQVRGENLIPVCLEDLPDLYPPDGYNWVVEEYNRVYYMDYLRQLAMYEAPRFRDVVRAKCSAERASVLTGNALMYVDMDIRFYNPPREWISPEGMLTFMDVQDMDIVRMVRQNDRDLYSLDTRVIERAGIQEENCMVMVGYEYAKLFQRRISGPMVRFNVLRGRDTGINAIMCFYQQASCISHGKHWTHGWWAAVDEYVV